ncbi:MAG: thiolase family protein [Clostridia bacterium]|nr:thiolase family protein [Clostridia bacterium]
MEEAVILEGVRTPIGRYGGGLRSVPAVGLGSLVIREVVERAGIRRDEVDEVVMGCCYQNGGNAYIARWASLTAGLPVTTSAVTVNRLCGSGLQAINYAAQEIALGSFDLCIAGGVESMSTVPFLAQEMRWGARLGNVTFVDGLVAVLTDPYLGYHMGVTAENLARDYGITREEQDAFALESHRRAVEAQREGRFEREIVPVPVDKKGDVLMSDEGPRADTTMDRLSKLPSAFIENGTVTAGNASSLNDAAAALVLASRSKAEQLGIRPRARIVAWAVAGTDPSRMGLGPVYATQKAMERAGLSLEDMDVIECNEAFAAQILACSKVLEWDWSKVNPNGGAIALGHPLGATGAILMVKLLHELERVNGRFGLATLCIGGGQGIATIIERE